MMFHPSMVNTIIAHCQNLGGHSNETRLEKTLQDIRMSIYINKEGVPSLVDTNALLLERTQRNLPVADIVPMRFHSGALKKLMELYKSYSGHAFETKLVAAIKFLDFTPYTSQTTQETIVVLTEEYMKTLQGVQTI